MINARQRKLLKALRTTGHFSPIARYAQLLSCSTKTVFNDVKTINAKLAETCPSSRIITKQGTGIRLELAIEDENGFEHLMLLSAGSNMTSLERFYRGIYLIATHSRIQLTLDDLARELFTNKTQIQAEIRHWNEMLSFFAVTIRSRKGSVTISGSEFNIRVAIIFYFYQTTPYFQTQVVENNLSHDVRLLSDAIIKLLEQSGITPYSAIARGSIGFYLCIALARMKKGCYVDREINGLVEEKDELICQIRAVLEGRLEKPVPNAEAHLFLSSRILSGMRHPTLPSGINNTEASILAHELRDRIEALFDQTIDRHTAQALETLIFQALLRGNEGFPVSLFSATPMKRCQLAYTIILEQIIKQLPHFGRHQFYVDDISRIAMLLIPFMSTQNTIRQRAIIVSNASFEVAHYVTYRITSTFPNIDIVDVVSSDEVTEPTSRQNDSVQIADFAITFDPLDAPLPTCRISPAIDGSDILHLHEFLLNLSRKWQRGPFEQSTRVIREATIEDVTQATYWSLRTDGLFQGSFETFRSQFLGHAAISSDGMTTAVYSNHSAFTGMRTFETPSFFAVQPVRTIYVLIVATKDISQIEKIAEHFTSIIDSNLSTEQSYGFPILIGAA